MDRSEPLLLVHPLHQAAEVIAWGVTGAATAHPVPGLRLGRLGGLQLCREIGVNQAGEVWLIPKEGRRSRVLGAVPQQRAVPGFFWATLPAI